MSAHLTRFSYDGDAVSEGDPKGAHSQSMMQVSDTEMAGNGRNGDNGDDTTATGNSASVLAVRGKVLGK